MLPLEIWDKILRYAIQHESENILQYDLSELSKLQTVCWEWYYLLDNNFVWSNICSDFPDYRRLQKRQHATAQNWRSICRDRLLGVYIQEVVHVGDINNPTAKYLIHVGGSGDLSIGIPHNNYSRSPIGLFKFSLHNDSYYQLTNLNRIISYDNKQIQDNPIILELDNLTLGPVFSSFYDWFTGVDYQELLKHEQSETMKDNFKVIDVAIYDPFVLILTKTQTVIEFMFVQDHTENGWSDMRIPRLISLPFGIVRIFAFDIGNFVIDTDYNVWVWTAIDHPFPDPEYIETQKKIQTEPLRLDAILHVNVVHIEPSFENESRFLTPLETRKKYIENSLGYLGQIFYFSEPPWLLLILLLVCL